MIKKSLRLLAPFLTRPISFRFFDTKLTEEKLKQLRNEYKQKPSLNIFKQYISSSSDYFKIFQLIEREPFCAQSYRDLKEQTEKIMNQTDNLRLLRGRITARIAQYLGKEGKKQQADKMFNQAIEIFEESLIPQVMPYYSVYRKYGFFLYDTGSLSKASDVLSESVEIMRQYVANSDDPVTANYHSIQQARACIKLVHLVPEQRQKWLKLANQYWKQCQHGIYDHKEYAETVYENSLNKKKANPKKARLYAQIEIQKIPNQKFHEIILRAFQGDKE